MTTYNSEKITLFTLKEKILFSLNKRPAQSIYEMADNFVKPRSTILEKLRTAKKQGLIKDNWIRKRNQTGGIVLCHIWTLTGRGKQWVKEHETP